MMSFFFFSLVGWKKDIVLAQLGTEKGVVEASVCGEKLAKTSRKIIKE